MARQSIPYDGYPQPGGDAIRIPWRGDHFGIANYNNGGYNLTAQSLGLSAMEAVWFSNRSQSGNFYAQVVYPANSNSGEQRAVPPTAVTIKWYFAANNVEAGGQNLANEVSMLEVMGI